MERVCSVCRKELTKTTMRIGTNKLLLHKEESGIKGIFSEYSGVDAFVCTNCGHVEFIAKNIEIFK